MAHEMRTMSFPMEFKLFEAFGIPVYVHIFLLAYFAWQLSNAEAAAKPTAMSGLPDYGKAAQIALLCTTGFLILFLTVLIHELGHCAGAKIVGGRVERILLWPLGGLAFCFSGGGPTKELIVSLAGPLTHAPQYAFWWALHHWIVSSPGTFGTYGPSLESITSTAMSLQIVLFIFNLFVPVYPLDCSKVIMSTCQLFGASARTAAVWMCFLSIMCLVALTASMLSLVQLPFIGMGWSPTNFMLLAWMAFQTYQLYSHISSRTEACHPLFCEMTEDVRQPLNNR